MIWWLNPLTLRKRPALPSKVVALRHQLRAARLGYLLPAALIAQWAALIPYLQRHLSLNHAQVGTLVFYFGMGSLVGMALASPLTKAWGSRITCSVAALGAMIFILALALLPPFYFACAFAACFALLAGLLEVGINIYGVSLERRYNLSLITPLHAYYSAGELLGAGSCLIFLNLGLSILSGIACFVALLALCALRYFPCISPGSFKASGEKAYMWPNATVACLCTIVFFTYMTGGAMVDWSGVFLASSGALDLQQAVIGYALVSLTMLIMRMAGNYLLRNFGALRVVLISALVLFSGLYLVSMKLPLWCLLFAFVLIGGGMANITPLSYRAAARQADMPLLPTVAAMSIAGYGGLLCGPALLGAVAYYLSLNAVFALLALSALISFLCMLAIRRHYR
ncbi:MAG: hypothetical protein IAA31_04235 [Candidatus Anaerobiospirillum merdipullorum]|uniref:MFS transporter n=1 Tax=Candidatus Anaerobiospirillum merdipullorum TaxID=2838450 RepID=A0A9E2NS19_9GAMM|nr:hypothetical protein [Candidatus Anaerobiospirillum merdipullorum]